MMKFSCVFSKCRGVCGTWLQCFLSVTWSIVWTSNGDRWRRQESQHVGCRKTKCYLGKSSIVLFDSAPLKWFVYLLNLMGTRKFERMQVFV